MDSNSSEKKPKRPRIGQTLRPAEETGESRPRFDNYAPRANGDGEQNTYQKRPYQPRPYNNNGGQRPYQPRPYNNNGGYQQRPYQQRPQYQDNANAGEEGASAENQNPRPYNRPNNGYNNGGGYNRNNNGGGYNRNNNGGGYNRNNNGGGYNRNNNGGGYNRNNNGGGYNRNNNGGGYNRNNNGGGYNRNNNGGQRQFNRNNYGGYNRNNGNSNGFPGRGKSFVPRPKPVEYEVEIPDPNEQIRLNKYMSNAGICSRREADEFIQQGLVKVNGQVVTELGTKITHSDVVEYDEKVVTLQSKCYILLNKPKDCVTTSDDPHGRTTVMDLVKGACNERIYPVGRLDRNTTGVLLLTNDGDLASKLTHPKFVKKKIYHVWCDRDISEEDMQRIADGIELDDGPIHADAISYATETDRNQAGIEIHSGRNRIVRRIFESLGYHVTKLDRVYFAGLTKKNLPRGRWRYLTQEEVNYLKMGSFE